MIHNLQCPLTHPDDPQDTDHSRIGQTQIKLALYASFGGRSPRRTDGEGGSGEVGDKGEEGGRYASCGPWNSLAAPSRASSCRQELCWNGVVVDDES